MRIKLGRLRQAETRHLIAVIVAGKMLGIAAVLGMMKGFAFFFETPAGASPVAAVAHTANDFVSPINTVWVLVTAFLVFFMQAGFMGLEAGFARSRETVNVLLECVFDTCLCGVLGEFRWSSQHPTMEVLGGCWQAAAGDPGVAWADVVAGSAVDRAS